MFSIFGSTSPFDTDVEKATSENNTIEQWDIIIDICDKAGASPKNAKDCLRAIMKRVGHNDPHVAIQAITLLDACIKNCGRTFHLEIASRDFETEFQRLLSKTIPSVAQKLRISLKKWAENEFKSEHQLNLIPSLYMKLKNEGVDFSDIAIESPVAKATPLSKDPNVVSSQQEEDDIAKAIELSLKEKTVKTQPSSASYANLYPNMGEKNSPTKLNQQTKKESRKVRALYDFEAAEDNELTFFSGEIIHVLDDSDSNWWTGYNDRGEGLFPSNFVTADLNAEIESNHYNANEHITTTKKEETQLQVISIDENKIDRLLYLLHEANPEDPSQDPEEMFILESQVHQMLPLIDTELERVDRHHAKLTQLSTSLVEAINMYHMLMRESDIQTFVQYPSHVYSPNGMFNPYMQQTMPGQPIGGSQYVNPSNTMGIPQFQPNQHDRSESTKPQHSQHIPQQFANQFQPIGGPDEQFQPQNAFLHQTHVPGTQHMIQSVPQMQPAAMFQHPHAVVPPEINPLNQSVNSIAYSEPMSLHYLPSTVMTTQVQQGVPHQAPMIHHPNANNQATLQPNAIVANNQPVSTNILSQSNIPVFQQQQR